MSDTHQIPVRQGSIHVTSDPEVTLYTPLGSCISACLFDPVAGVGGMNHFMLPRPPGNDNAASPGVFGIFAMPMLLDAMIEAGARPERIRAKLFGGSRNVFGGRDIGMMNRDLAEDFLHDSGVRCLGGITCTDEAISVSFRAALGLIEGRRYQKRRETHVPVLEAEIPLVRRR
jgi:chemotaxis protein CheD